MKKVIVVFTTLLLSIALLGSGCTGSPTAGATSTATAGVTATSTVAPYGTLTVVMPEMANITFDPIYGGPIMGPGMFDTLLSWDESGHVVPNIAESYEMSSEGVWTFHIRRDVTFHNGDPLTAEDVKFSVDRYGDTSISMNPISAYLSEGYNKKGSVVVDEYTYQFIGERPELQQGSIFAALRILPKNYFESLHTEGFAEHPVGSGPWKFVELTSATDIKLEANPDYWGQVPAYHYLVIQQVAEQFTRLAMLMNGQADITALDDGSRYDELTAQGYRLQVFGLPFLLNILFKGTWLPGAGPTSDIRVRQAMSYAINRQELCDTVLPGAEPGGAYLMHRGAYGWDDALLPEGYDPVKAKELLAEAGYPEAFGDPTVHVAATVWGQSTVAPLIGYWKEVGLNVKMEIIDPALFMGMLFSRPEAGDPHAGWVLYAAEGGEFNSTYGAANVYLSTGSVGTSNDTTADRMYAGYLAETDPARAEKLWIDFQIYAKSLYVAVGIVETEQKLVVRPDIGEFTGKTWLGLWFLTNSVQHPE